MGNCWCNLKSEGGTYVYIHIYIYIYIYELSSKLRVSALYL